MLDLNNEDLMDIYQIFQDIQDSMSVGEKSVFN